MITTISSIFAAVCFAIGMFIDSQWGQLILGLLTLAGVAIGIAYADTCDPRNNLPH